MGEELVNEKRFYEIFEDCFPFYLSLGMSPDEYWGGDCCLTVAYRKAWELQQEQKSRDYWLLGRYVHDAIVCAYPVLNPLSKEKKTLPYVAEPYPVTEEGRKQAEERQKQRQYQEWIDYLNGFQ